MTIKSAPTTGLVFIAIATTGAAVAAFGSNFLPAKYLVQEGNSAVPYGRRSTTTSLDALREEDQVSTTLDGAASLIWNALGALTARVYSDRPGGSNSLLCDGQSDPKATGTVSRTAARSERADGSSRSSSPRYTPRKDPLPLIRLLGSGVAGDYNDYRSRALGSTPDRAVSILTSDVMTALRAGDARGEGGYGLSAAEDGDLGENVLVDGVGYRFFEVGGRYCFRAPSDSGGGGNGGGEDSGAEGCVVVQITEPAVPCANLCKLPYINNVDLEPVDRIERCKKFLDRLGRADGIRGWYAKVIGMGGTIRPGFEVTALV